MSELCCKRLAESLIIRYEKDPFTKDYPEVRPGWYATIVGYDTGPDTYDEEISYCPFCGSSLDKK